ncbi:PREDICTED: LOW QUALITY PROTEIN: thrombopoietin [Calidris pugnax]|uniref:LOW QUALITY PROTEIN: thrombopoietin n=1 Tax=Calidris pugnax TaxID=198806 RepID=UPI00071E1416|nr:PREDICTED: LOW QUALITY PROTEIN: thrombopoietin [Calidris pugnax]
MELNRLLLLTAFLLHLEEGPASPARLVCDSRLINKYIEEAKEMEKGVEGNSPLPPPPRCQALPALGCPTVLPSVDFNAQQWRSQSNESKRRELLCDLALLVGAAAGARGQLRQDCGATQLGQLYRQANAFLLLLQTFQWEAGPWEPGCPPRSVEQTDITSIFLVYRRLLQGKLRLFLHSLTKDSC